MHLWHPDDLQRIDAVVGRARAGEPHVLVVEAEAGFGKSALLNEIAASAPDFRVLRADGLEGDTAPFTLLSQWDADPTISADSSDVPTRVAALVLRNRLDAVSTAGPVLLAVDDLHWADPESVEALLWLLRRTSGDRLLVAVATRPLVPELHTGWQRWVASRPPAVHIRLQGLNTDQIVELGRYRWPELSRELAERLHEHTGGNPLYLTSLLAEHNLDELAAAGMLPPPALFARSIATRAARLDDAALALLRSVCILGSSWTPLAQAAAVCEMGAPSKAAQQLAEASFVNLDRASEPLRVRPAHALIRASIHQQTPLPLLRSLHARAATLVESRSAALQHRMAAAEQYDNVLADDMADYAEELFAKRSFRLAGQYLRWASALTSRPALREKRWLQSLHASVVATDLPFIAAEIDDVLAAGESAWRSLVLGRYAIQQRRYQDAISFLTPVVDGGDPVDDPVCHRAAVLLGWARMCLGHPTEDIVEALDQVADVRTGATECDGLELVARSQIAIRQDGIGPILDGLAMMPAAHAVPLPATGALAFRGALRATMGLTREAEADLEEATRRIVDGVTDLGAGSFHAHLGFVQWLNGDWARARVSSGRPSTSAGMSFIR